MKNREVAALTEKYVAKTYARAPIALVKGKGTKVWDADGKEYLDFLAGIAVNSLGHCNPAIVKAIKRQAQQLLHVSNLYHIQPQAELARELCRNSFHCKPLMFQDFNCTITDAAHTGKVVHRELA